MKNCNNCAKPYVATAHDTETLGLDQAYLGSAMLRSASVAVTAAAPATVAASPSPRSWC